MSTYQFTLITKNNKQPKVYIKVPIVLPDTHKWQKTAQNFHLMTRLEIDFHCNKYIG